MIYLPEIATTLGDHLWEEDEYKDDNRREPQKKVLSGWGCSCMCFARRTVKAKQSAVTDRTTGPPNCATKAECRCSAANRNGSSGKQQLMPHHAAECRKTPQP